MHKPLRRKNQSAFTLVEIIIVITVIAILATLGVISYGAWRNSVAETEVKNDLAGAQAGMEDSRNFGNAYPVFSFDSEFDGTNETRDTFIQSEGVRLSYNWGDGRIYCIGASSIARPEVSYHLDTSSSTGLQPGTCGEYTDEDEPAEPEEPAPVPVAALTGPLTVVATMSSAAVASGTGAGGSCVEGATIERQMRWESTSTATPGVYSEWAATNPANAPAQEGSRYTFQQRARCVGVGGSSDWVQSDSASVVRPITYTPPAPTISNSTSGDVTTFTFGGTHGCPTGTTMQRQGVSEASWNYVSNWGPYDNYTSRTWTTTNQGHDYNVRAQTRCVTVHSDGPWSGNSATSTYVREVSPPGHATNFTFTVAPNRLSYQYTWTQPACGPGTIAESRYNTFIGPSPMTWVTTGTHGWLFGPDGWSEVNFYSAVFTVNMNAAIPLAYNVDAQHRVQHICVNATTGRMSAWGPVTTSPMFKT